jgi:hypothetical protein
MRVLDVSISHRYVDIFLLLYLETVHSEEVVVIVLVEGSPAPGPIHKIFGAGSDLVLLKPFPQTIKS